jgi:two-component system chemotaxis response regulator CheY
MNDAKAPVARPDLLAEAFRDPLLEVLNEICGIRMNAEAGPQVTPPGPAIALEISGDIRGRIVLNFEERFARLCVRGMLAKMGLSAGEEDFRPALAELGNILMGHIDGKLSELGINGTISIPRIAGTPPPPGQLTAPPSAIGLNSPAGALKIDLYLLAEREVDKGMAEKRLRALVVDDSLIMRRALKGILERHGYQVIAEAADGFEAIKLFKELQPDLVTLDIIMPRLAGVEVLRLMKNLDPSVCILMVTAMTSQNKVLECAKFGAEHYIVKPFEEEKIVEVLKRIFPDGTV